MLRNISGKLHRFAQKYRPYGKTKVEFCGENFYMYAKADDNIMSEIYYHVSREKNESLLMWHLARHSKTVFDVGANTGNYTLMMSKCNPALDVYAFEPHPTNFKRLEHNVKLNDLQRVKLVQKAVGNSQQNISFTIPENDSISDVSSVNGTFTKAYYGIRYKEIEVEQVCLDDFISEHHLKPNFIKIDVEYYELSVLEGMSKYLDEHSPNLMLEIFLFDFIKATKPQLIDQIDSAYAQKIEQFLVQKGYSIYMVCKHGLYRTNSALDSPDHTNYFFSKHQTENRYVLYNSKEFTDFISHISQ